MPRASQQLADIMDKLQGARQRIARLESAIRQQERDQQQVRPSSSPVCSAVKLQSLVGTSPRGQVKLKG